MTVPTILPRNATALERAIEQSSAGRIATVNPNTIRDEKFAQTCPVELLPFLAYEFSVDLWNPDWPEARKRRVITQSIRLHRLKGTRAGIAAHLEEVDAALKRAVVPPAKTFLMPSYTQAEKEAFLARFPQLRVYPFVTRSHQRFGHFTNMAAGRAKAFLGFCFPMNVGAQNRWVRVAKLWDRGVETALTTRSVHKEHVGSFVSNEYEEIVLPAKGSRAIFLGARPRAKNFFVASVSVAERIISIPRSTAHDLWAGRAVDQTVSPGLDLIDVRPSMVAERHQRPRGSVFPSRKNSQFLSGLFLPPSVAWRHVYERWYLFDPDRVPDVRRRSVHLGYTRLGMPAFNAELLVRVFGRPRNRREVWGFVHGYFRAPNRDALNAAVEAVRVSKAARDKVLINTKTRRPPRPGDRLKVGSIRVGDMIEA